MLPPDISTGNVVFTQIVQETHTPTPAPDRGGPVACLGDPMIFGDFNCFEKIIVAATPWL